MDDGLLLIFFGFCIGWGIGYAGYLGGELKRGIKHDDSDVDG